MPNAALPRLLCRSSMDGMRQNARAAGAFERN